MNKNSIKNSSDLFLYKAIVDLNSGKYLLEAFNEDKIEIDIEKTSLVIASIPVIARNEAI